MSFQHVHCFLLVLFQTILSFHEIVMQLMIALRFVICMMQEIFTHLDCRLSEFTKAFSFFSVVDVRAPKYLLSAGLQASTVNVY